MLPTTDISNARIKRKHPGTTHNPFQTTLQNAIDQIQSKLATMTKQQLQALIVFLSMGLLLVLWNAFGARVPSPDGSNAADLASLGDVKSMGQRYSNVKSGIENDNKNNKILSDNPNEKKNRLAIVIPYLPPSDGAPTLPSYFDLFAMSAAGSADIIDYLIFHCFIPPSLLPDPSTLPSNIKLIDLNPPKDPNNPNELGECLMSSLFIRVTDQRQAQNLLSLPLSRLTTLLSHQILRVPYILVEYKPAFGHVFADYLKEYSHWGYSDLDVVLGDMSRWISPEEWTDFDIVTYGFGDQDKLYLRGQFTFHKNEEKINQLWRHCKYLSELDVRYADLDTLKFESAEGCYSQAVIVRKDVKVKYAVKAFSDVGVESPIYAHGMYMSVEPDHGTGGAAGSAKSVLYTSSTIESGSKLLTLPTNWYQNPSLSSYPNQDLTLQHYHGPRTKVQTHRTKYNSSTSPKEKRKLQDVKCMYWAPKEYQMDLCTIEGSVGSDEVVFLEEGVLWKQKFGWREGVFPEGIRSMPFFHFQEWKRTYRTTQLLPSLNIRQSISNDGISGIIITKEGTLPLFTNNTDTSNIKGHKHIRPLPLSWPLKGTPNAPEWMMDTGSSVEHSSKLKFCLMSSKKGNPVGATICKLGASWPVGRDENGAAGANGGSAEGEASVHILRSPVSTLESTFTSSDSKFRAHGMSSAATPTSSWWDSHQLDPNNDVTLILTLQITSTHMRDPTGTTVRNLIALADSNIFMWGGRQPSVLVVYMDSSLEYEGKEGEEAVKRTVQLITNTFGIDHLPSGSDGSDAKNVPNTNPDIDTSNKDHLRNALITLVHAPQPLEGTEQRPVSRNALINMASHAAPTRWIVTGLELERGLVLSPEASIFCMRQAKVYEGYDDKTRGHLFWMPQFASRRDDTRDETISELMFPEGRLMFGSVGADLLPTIRGKKSMTSDLAEYDCNKCDGTKSFHETKEDDEEELGEGLQDEEEDYDDAEREEGDLDDGAEKRRRLSDSSSNESSIDQRLEDLWWDLSVAQVYGTPGGFNALSSTKKNKQTSSQTTSSIDAMAKVQNHIEVSLISLLDRTEEHLNYLRYFDHSPILMIDRLGPKKGMLTLDLAPNVEEFGGGNNGRNCFRILQLAQLATLGYKISVLPGAFASSYPKTRSGLCGSGEIKANGKKKDESEFGCGCDLGSEKTIKEVLMDEAKRVGKVAVLLNELEARKSDHMASS